MEIKLSDARYVVAVSGGVDSVVLLDCLVASNPELVNEGKLIVAHYDHGIREDSIKDALFVEELAEKYGLQFVVGHGGLGANASEETARNARYKFLNLIKVQNRAEAIITAHHQDDVIETAYINLIRGTGRKGLTSLKSRPGILRPLISKDKIEILEYAKNKNLLWHEDLTNKEDKYLRNRVRKVLEENTNPDFKNKILNTISHLEEINKNIDSEIDKILGANLRRSKNVVPRRWFLKLNYEVASEVVVALARSNKFHEIDQKLVEMLVVFMKTAKIGKKLDIDKNHYALITKRSVRFISR